MNIGFGWIVNIKFYILCSWAGIWTDPEQRCEVGTGIGNDMVYLSFSFDGALEVDNTAGHRGGFLLHNQLLLEL